jgi:Spy/CpxP family protein refolding chaperone
MNALSRIAVSGVLAGLVVVGIHGSGWAQTPSGHPPMGKGGMMGGMKGGAGGMFSPGFFQEELGLSADQIEKFKKMRNDYEKESIRRRADIKIAEIELWELVGKKDATSDQIEKKVRETEGKKTDLRVYRFKHLATLKTILTPEQFEKFRSMGFMMFGGGGGRYSGMGMTGGMMEHGMKRHGGYGSGGYGGGGDQRGYDDSSDED